jgi:molybdate transport system permease protein
MIALTPLEIEALRLSLKIGLAAVVLSLPFGILVALILARGRFIGRGALDVLVHLPLVLPPVVVGYVLLVLLGRNGPIGGWLFQTFGLTLAFTWRGAAVSSAIMAFPLMVRAIRLSIESIDRGIEAAAATLGASPLRVFGSVTLPLALPGILTGAILAFARSLGEFGATITFVADIPGQTRTLPIALYGLIQSPGGEAAAARLCVIAILVTAITLVAAEMLARRVERRLRG